MISPPEQAFVNVLLWALIQYWKSNGSVATMPTDLSHSALEKTFVKSDFARWAVKWVWGQMDQLAYAAVRPQGGASRIWDVLLKNPSKNVVFVGASAGARLLARLLRSRTKASPNFRPHLVFCAPAVSIEEWAQTLNDIGNRLKSSTLFTMADNRERTDPLFWGWDPAEQDKSVLQMAYPASLLYLISRVLDANTVGDAVPLVGMQVFHPSDNSIFATWLAGATVRYSGLSPNRGGFWSDACYHGDFDDNKIYHCSNCEQHHHCGNDSVEWLSIKNLLV